MDSANSRAATTKINVIDMLRRERKWSHIECSIKITKERKSVEDKNRSEEQGH